MNIHRLVNSLGSELMEEKSTSNPTKNQGIRPILMKRTIVPDGSQIYKKVGDKNLEQKLKSREGTAGVQTHVVPTNVAGAATVTR